MFFDLSNISNKPVLCVFVPFCISFVFTVCLLPIYIYWLKRQQIGQFIREEGPASHAVKAKTPTTGGVLFVLSVWLSLIIYTSLFQRFNTVAIATVVLATATALLGLIDDASKLMNRANKGISAATRLMLEVLFGVLMGLLLIYIQPQAKDIILTMASYVTDAGQATAHIFTLPNIVFIALAAAMIASTTNSVNLNDGMDGLAAGVAFPILLALCIMLMWTNNFTLAAVAMACAGTVAAFLLFNCYPAKIFMGDVGSLFLGGIIGALVISSGLTIWFIPLALIYILETLSVMIQVSVFKLTKPYKPEKPMNKFSLAIYKLTHRLPGEGKRVFRMSPLHHHFEAALADNGVAEWQVVTGFWVFQLAICIIVLAAFIRI